MKQFSALVNKLARILDGTVTIGTDGLEGRRTRPEAAVLIKDRGSLLIGWIYLPEYQDILPESAKKEIEHVLEDYAHLGFTYCVLNPRKYPGNAKYQLLSYSQTNSVTAWALNVQL